MLAEAQVQLEKPLVVPEGYTICTEDPWEEALAFAKPASAASKSLVGRRIMRRWEGFGSWMAGTITSVNEEGRSAIHERGKG